MQQRRARDTRGSSVGTPARPPNQHGRCPRAARSHSLKRRSPHRRAGRVLRFCAAPRAARIARGVLHCRARGGSRHDHRTSRLSHLRRVVRTARGVSHAATLHGTLVQRVGDDHKAAARNDARWCLSQRPRPAGACPSLRTPRLVAAPRRARARTPHLSSPAAARVARQAPSRPPPPAASRRAGRACSAAPRCQPRRAYTKGDHRGVGWSPWRRLSSAWGRASGCGSMWSDAAGMLTDGRCHLLGAQTLERAPGSQNAENAPGAASSVRSSVLGRAAPGGRRGRDAHSAQRPGEARRAIAAAAAAAAATAHARARARACVQGALRRPSQGREGACARRSAGRRRPKLSPRDPTRRPIIQAGRCAARRSHATRRCPCLVVGRQRQCVALAPPAELAPACSLATCPPRGARTGTAVAAVSPRAGGRARAPRRAGCAWSRTPLKVRGDARACFACSRLPPPQPRARRGALAHGTTRVRTMWI